MAIWQDLIKRGRPAPEHVCTSCKGKYKLTESTQFCPHCGFPSPRYYEETGGLTLDQQRTLIGGALVVLLAAGGAGLYWNLQSGDEDISYRLLGRTDVTWTVETRVPRGDGTGLRVAGQTTYFSRPGYLRVDLEEAGQPPRHALSRIANFESHQLATVDGATNLMYSESLASDTLQQRLYAAAVKTAALPPTAAGAITPALFDPSRPLQARLVQAESVTPSATPEMGASRTMHIENLGREKIAGYRATHYRLTATVINLKCSTIRSGSEAVEIWVADRATAVPLNPTPTPESGAAHPSGGKAGDNIEESVPTPTPTADPNATAAAPSPAPTLSATAAPGAPAPGPTPLPFPTPYAGPEAVGVVQDIANADPAQAACNAVDIPQGSGRDFANLYRGLILRYRAYRGNSLVLEQEVTRVRHREITLDEVSTNQYREVSSDEFWAKRNAELANPAPSPTAAPAASPSPSPSPPNP